MSKKNNKKMLYDLEKSVKKLEYEIKSANVNNFKSRSLRDLKIVLRTGQLLAPHMLLLLVLYLEYFLL